MPACSLRFPQVSLHVLASKRTPYDHSILFALSVSAEDIFGSEPVVLKSVKQTTPDRGERETTPDLFAKVDIDSQMSLFSPTSKENKVRKMASLQYICRHTHFYYIHIYIHMYVYAILYYVLFLYWVVLLINPSSGVNNTLSSSSAMCIQFCTVSSSTSGIY